MATTWRANLITVVLALALCAGLVGRGQAADTPVGPDAQQVRTAIDKAMAFLKARQGPDGSYSPRLAGPGVSAVVAAALLRNGSGPKDPFVARTLAYLEKHVRKDGGIYDKSLANYTTSVAMMAFAEANTDGRYDEILKNGERFLKGLQYGDKVKPTDQRYGGMGYDGKRRPDMSNTGMFLDALKAAGVSKDDPAVQRALMFVSRCQNLPGETNDLPFAKKTTADDRGGLVYNPLEPSKRDQTPAGGLRSAGSMTYAGLKSFLYAGVSREDLRVKGALRWIRAHYTLDQNPGMGQAGLYYYYHTFAKAMAALGDDQFKDTQGLTHDWRKDLFKALKDRQRPDGSWANQTQDFGEGNPDLATAFALLALSYCQPPTSK